MDHTYAPLFRPGRIGNLELKNRIVMAPMDTFHDHMSPELIDYYMERARGGVGMIVVQTQFTLRQDYGAVGRMYLDSDSRISDLYKLAEAVHAYGAKICASIGCGFGRNAPPSDGSPPVSASALPSAYDPNMICRPMSVQEIQDTADSFADAAGRCKRAGFDAVEIDAHAGRLVDQFMSAVWNQRADGYGGSLEGRMRFPLEILQAVRKEAGDFPVLFRMAAEHKTPDGRSLAETLEIVKFLEGAGVDALDIGAGCHGAIDWVYPTRYLGDACTSDLAAEIKKHVHIPVLGGGGHTPETALEAVRSGAMDFVTLGRPLIADPLWPGKLIKDRPGEIRPCLRCNEFCVKGLYSRRGLSCGVNAQAMREKRFACVKTNAPKRVAVVGAGPAGLEAARAAAEKGHMVTVFEKEERIGGQLAMDAVFPFSKARALLSWYELQLAARNVDIRLKTEVLPGSVELKGFDELVVAVGAGRFASDVAGLDGKKVLSVRNARFDPSCVNGDRVVILGGGMSGMDLAIVLAAAGKQVKVIETQPVIASDAFYVNLASVYRSMARYGIETLCNHKAVRITEKGVAALYGSGEVVIEGDVVVNALGAPPDRALANGFRAEHPGARFAGGCTGAWKVGDAIRSGFFAGFAIE